MSAAGTPFATILRAAVERVPGALGAVFADHEGETVDHYSLLEPFDTKLIGAHLGVLLDQARKACEGAGVGAALAVVVRGERGFVVRPVADGYYVVMALAPYTPTALALRALDVAAGSLRREM